MSENFKILESIRIDSSKWEFFDFRLNIPPMSFGSDASNPHTQYSNAIASFTNSGMSAVGACFTLGEGNQYICAAAEYLIKQLDGILLKDLLESRDGIAEILVNPIQLRWISPNAGLSKMAAGLILNTILDYACKQANLPAWKFLTTLEVEELLKLVSLRHLKNSKSIERFYKQNFPSDVILKERIEILEVSGIPAYFTTWIGSSAESLSEQMRSIEKVTGITRFKIKIGSNIVSEKEKIERLIELLPSHYRLAADANQRLTYLESVDWMSYLSGKGFMWLEEPFAPDNILLFRELVKEKIFQKWDCGIATGENCPNLQVAEAILDSGVDRFQADPCRMMGIFDGIFVGVLTKFYGSAFTPHAGGAGLDEMTPHMQFFNLATISHNMNINDSLTENIGFCSSFYQAPTQVVNGRIKAPTSPGFLVGFNSEVLQKLVPYRDGVSWLEL